MNTLKQFLNKKKLFKTLKKKLWDEREEESESSKIKQHSGTQTQFPNSCADNHSSYFLLQLTQLKLLQNQIEQQLKLLQEQLHSKPEQKMPTPVIQITPVIRKLL